MYADNRNILVLHEQEPLVLARTISRQSCATNLVKTLQTAFAGKQLLMVVALGEDQRPLAEPILRILAGTGAHLAFAEADSSVPAAELARLARSVGAHGLAVGPYAEGFRFGIQQGQYYAAVIYAGCKPYVQAAQKTVAAAGYVEARLQEAARLDEELKGQGCSGPKPL